MFKAIIVAAILCAANVAHADKDRWRKVQPSDDPRINGILARDTWTPSKLLYAFPEKPFSAEPKGPKFQPLGDAQRRIVRKVFHEIEMFSNLQFQEVGDPNIADLTFARWDQPSRVGVARGQWPNPDGKWIDIPGQMWISKMDEEWSNESDGSYSMRWWRHEIGHIVGLEHPHNNRYFTPLPASLDNVSHTLMGYRLVGDDFLDLPHDRNIYPTSYMPLDILAIQHLWGVKWATNMYDTTYKFSPETGDYWVNGKRQIGNPTGKLFLTLWDGFGDDTLDFSAYDTNGTFDMRPGHFSTPSPDQLVHFSKDQQAEGSIAMPMLPNANRYALIENIIVGNGSNTITLNAADNHVTLGRGRNRIVVEPGTGQDTITGFDADDCLDFSNYRIHPSFIHINGNRVTFRQWRDVIETDGPARMCPSDTGNASVAKEDTGDE